MAAEGQSSPPVLKQAEPCRIDFPGPIEQKYAALYVDLDTGLVRMTRGHPVKVDQRGHYVSIPLLPSYSGFPFRVHWKKEHVPIVGLLDELPTNNPAGPQPVRFIKVTASVVPLKCRVCKRENGASDPEHAPIGMSTQFCSSCDRIPECVECGDPGIIEGPGGTRHCFQCARSLMQRSGEPVDYFYMKQDGFRPMYWEEIDPSWPWDEEGYGDEIQIPESRTGANSCHECNAYFRYFAFECDSCSGYFPGLSRVCYSCRFIGVHQTHRLKMVRIDHFPEARQSSAKSARVLPQLSHEEGSSSTPFQGIFALGEVIPTDASSETRDRDLMVLVNNALAQIRDVKATLETIRGKLRS